MILIDMEHFRNRIEVSDDGQSIKEFSIADGEKPKANGTFFESEGRQFGLGAMHGLPWLLLGGVLACVTPRIRVAVVEEEGRRTFLAFDGDELIEKFTYVPKKPHWNFFAMEDEDVDGFTWIHNVLASPERTAIFLSAYS